MKFFFFLKLYFRLGESNRLLWNFTDISQNSQDGGVGTLRARLELNDGPSTPAMLTTQFNCEGTTLSGIEFELKGGGYRLSLVKRRFVAGKYEFCNLYFFFANFYSYFFFLLLFVPRKICL